MSSVSGIGSSSIYQYLQAMQASQTGSASATQGATTSNPVNSDDIAASQPAPKTHGHHHGAGGGHSSRIQQLQAAVTSALQSAQSDPSADPNQVVESALASIFKNGLNASSSTSSTSNPNETSDDATGQTTDADTQQASFAQTLQEYGIDSSQFQQDFQTAVQQAQGGQINPNTAFQSFPPGVIVDTTA